MQCVVIGGIGSYFPVKVPHFFRIDASALRHSPSSVWSLMQTPSGARLHLCGDTRAVAAARFIKRPSLFRAFIKANPFLLIASRRGIRATKNRALQRAGDTNMRMNAKELIADARVTAPTLPPAAAKLMTAMADRLDLQFVALCESRNEVTQLAAENARFKFEISRFHQTVDEMFNHREKWVDKEWLSALWSTSKRIMDETPTTDSALASLRAEGVEMAIEHLHKKFEGTGRVGVPVMALEWLAAQLRSKSEVQS